MLSVTSIFFDFTFTFITFPPFFDAYSTIAIIIMKTIMPAIVVSPSSSELLYDELDDELLCDDELCDEPDDEPPL